MSESLLTPDEPPPFRVVDGAPRSPFLITCDHAGKVLPSALGTLGLEAVDLERHIAWDLGAAPVAERVARELGAFSIAQTYSRLAIDCNRPLGTPSSIAKVSEATLIPGNQNVSTLDAERRAEAIFRPYHRRIEAELDRRHASGTTTVYVALHSFTPRYLGHDRPWHLGVLYWKDARFAHALLRRLRADATLVVGDNQPYLVNDLSDYGVVVHAETRGLPYAELEIRQDLIEHEGGRRHWAGLLARALRETLRLDWS